MLLARLTVSSSHRAEANSHREGKQEVEDIYHYAKKVLESQYEL